MNDEADNDKALFRSAMQDVTPLRTARKVSKRHPRPPSTPRVGRQAEGDLTERFSNAVVSEACPTHLDFHRGGVQNAVLRKLRQGRLPVENTLDLHGLTVDAARGALMQFLDECRELDCRSVIIVHGKGFRSAGNKPVIKPMLNRWLQQAEEVLAFCSAQPKDGGTGSVYVLLKK